MITGGAGNRFRQAELLSIRLAPSRGRDQVAETIARFDVTALFGVTHKGGDGVGWAGKLDLRDLFLADLIIRLLLPCFEPGR